MTTTLDSLIAVVGRANAISDPADMAPYLVEGRGKWVGKSPLILRPSSTQQVSDILKIASYTNTKIVPQSGNTGLVGGGIPNSADSEVVLSLNRMTRIMQVDAANASITVEAGAVLKSVQDAASDAGMLYPLSLASEGSCRIGGTLASNAGGLNVVAYGNARDLCLGLEVVLADGRIWNGMRGLRKDNTGYDLKNLFIGSEGTLGVITAAVLKLFPQPRRKDTAIVAVPSPEAAVSLLSRCKHHTGTSLAAFELLPHIGIDFAVRHMQAVNPLQTPSPWYVLLEAADAMPDSVEEALATAMESGDATDAVIAQTEAQRHAFWHVRECLSDAQKFEGGSIKHDVSVPISRIPHFIAAAAAAVEEHTPGCRLVCFGHLGDGNLHFNVSQPPGMDKAAYLARWESMNDLVHRIVMRHGGSISAEHGIGVLKREAMRTFKSPVELQMMRDVKRMLDPMGILNPGKVLPDM